MDSEQMVYLRKMSEKIMDKGKNLVAIVPPNKYKDRPFDFTFIVNKKIPKRKEFN